MNPFLPYKAKLATYETRDFIELIISTNTYLCSSVLTFSKTAQTRG